MYIWHIHVVLLYVCDHHQNRKFPQIAHKWHVLVKHLAFVPDTTTEKHHWLRAIQHRHCAITVTHRDSERFLIGKVRLAAVSQNIEVLLF